MLQEYINLYNQNYSLTQIAKQYKMCRHNLAKILKPHVNLINKRKRKYYPDNNYFNNIDSETKAYMLGFIFADGSVCKNSNRIKIEILNIDRSILEKFSMEIYKENLVKTRIKKENNKTFAYLNIYSNQIKNDLSKYSCVPNKSKILTFPNINESYYNHFIRGLIDGDGFVSHKTKTIGLLSTNNINTKIKEIFNSLNINSFIIKANKQDKNILNEIRVKKQSSLLNLIDFLYNNSNIYLERKYDSAMKIKKILMQK
jgi:hypothetical protein